jgi:peptidoglycan/LPS O-acetylase OafA/YrhL
MTDSAALHRTPIRREIQALRAIAIGAVVLYHSWPGLAPGGQVGVDVFFVVSGFLITGMLVREAAASGTISTPRFYLRRATRLLPSAIIVLSFCVVMTAWVCERDEQRQFYFESVGSLLYAQNWIQLLGDGATTPMQHFWSLAVEEQFYLLWPMLVLLAVALARRFAADKTKALAVVLGAVTVLSFAYCVWQTGQDHAVAYYSTFARAWEFGVGGLLALAPKAAWMLRPQLRAALSWAGLAVILGSVLIAADQETFPGVVAAAPVLGTAAVIAAGTTGIAWAPDRILEFAPVQWQGGISYALYLWHWPLLAFAPYVTGVPSESWFMVILLAAAVVLAWATTRWIEIPIRVAARVGRSRAEPIPARAGLMVSRRHPGAARR